MKIHVRILTIPGPMCVPSIRVWQSTYFVHTNLYYQNLLDLQLSSPFSRILRASQPARLKSLPAKARASQSGQGSATQGQPGPRASHPAGPKGQPARWARGPTTQPSRRACQPGPSSQPGPRASQPARQEGLPVRQAQRPVRQPFQRVSQAARPEGQSVSQA